MKENGIKRERERKNKRDGLVIKFTSHKIGRETQNKTQRQGTTMIARPN